MQHCTSVQKLTKPTTRNEHNVAKHVANMATKMPETMTAILNISSSCSGCHSHEGTTNARNVKTMAVWV